MVATNNGLEPNALIKEKAQLLLSMGKLMHKLVRDGEFTNNSCIQLSERLIQIDAHLCLVQGGNVPEQGSGICPLCKAALVSPMAGFCGVCGANINEFYSQNMRKCEKCGQLTNSTGCYCTVCGVRHGSHASAEAVNVLGTSQMDAAAKSNFCEQCGQNLPHGLRFCTKCGAKCG